MSCLQTDFGRRIVLLGLILLGGVLVGEATAGANHFGGFEPIGDGLAAFIPVGRTFDPDTGKDWEGVGVSPDVAVPADQALDKAPELAGR